jgi:hypothetical protein
VWCRLSAIARQQPSPACGARLCISALISAPIGAGNVAIRQSGRCLQLWRLFISRVGILKLIKVGDDAWVRHGPLGTRLRPRTASLAAQRTLAAAGLSAFGFAEEACWVDWPSTDTQPRRTPSAGGNWDRRPTSITTGLSSRSGDFSLSLIGLPRALMQQRGTAAREATVDESEPISRLRQALI